MTVDKKALANQTNKSVLCPIRYMMDIFGGKWKLPIICVLSSGKPARYSTIKRKLGDITNVMLSQSLKELEASGMLARKQYNEIPPRVEYTLTDKGKSILPTLAQMAKWAGDSMQQDIGCGVYCDKCFLMV